MKKQIFLLMAILLLSTTANAQKPLILELQIPVNGLPAGTDWAAFPSSARDADGDGVADLAIISPRDPATGQATGALKVKSGDSNEIWEYPLTGYIDDLVGWNFLGFYELNANSPLKEAVFAHKQGRQFNQPVVLHPTTTASMNMQFLVAQFLIDIADADRDGDLELQLYNAQHKQMELWGQGPQLAIFPTAVSLKVITLDVWEHAVIYRTRINGQIRKLFYRFKPNQTADISVEDSAGTVLLSYNSANVFQIPAGADEAAGWLLTQNLIVNRSVGVLQLWSVFHSSFSDTVEASASRMLGGIGGIIRGIPKIKDLLCNAGGAATCEDDDGTETITCDCGIPDCRTEQVAVEVVIVEVDPSGERTTRTEVQYRDECICTCLKLSETK